MPLTYRIDQHAGLVVSRGAGLVTDQDVIEKEHALLADPGARSCRFELVDLREVGQFEVSSETMRKLAQMHAETAEGFRKSRVAIIALSDATFGMWRMYQALVEGSGLDVRVFRETNEARNWLGVDPKVEVPAR
jgi:hypothetical protein